MAVMTAIKLLWQTVTCKDSGVENIARIDLKSAIASQDFHELLMPFDRLAHQAAS